MPAPAGRKRRHRFMETPWIENLDLRLATSGRVPETGRWATVDWAATGTRCRRMAPRTNSGLTRIARGVLVRASHDGPRTGSLRMVIPGRVCQSKKDKRRVFLANLFRTPKKMGTRLFQTRQDKSRVPIFLGVLRPSNLPTYWANVCRCLVPRSSQAKCSTTCHANRCKGVRRRWFGWHATCFT
jgi:hypothetical protein